MLFLKMPKLVKGAEEGTILEWIIEEGQEVEKGDSVLKVKSDETSREIKAEESGILREIYAQEGSSVPPGSVIGKIDTRRVKEQRPLKGMRKTIANRLSQSYSTAVHMTLHKEIDISTLEGFRKGYGAEKIPLSDFILAGVRETLIEHPELNSNYQDNKQIIFETINLGYAVDTEKGLLVPVIENVEDLGIKEINKRRRELLEKVLEDKHSPEDLQGGTFTVTNLGPLEIDVFSPIINPPEIGILGIGRKRDEKITFSLTFDHRFIDGADGARFLKTLEEKLNNPEELSK